MAYNDKVYYHVKYSGSNYIGHSAYFNNELYHYGVVGMKWGVRRYQNEDGSLTAAGRARQAKQYSKELNRMDKQSIKDKRAIKDAEKRAKRFEKASEFLGNPNYKTEAKKARESVNENRKRVARNEEAVAKLVKKIEKEGYSVNSKKIQRDASTAKDWARDTAITAALFTVASAAAAPYAIVLMPAHTVEGTKYKVKNLKG